MYFLKCETYQKSFTINEQSFLKKANEQIRYNLFFLSNHIWFLIKNVNKVVSVTPFISKKFMKNEKNFN